MTSQSVRFMSLGFLWLLSSASAGCGGQMAIRFGAPPKAYVPPASGRFCARGIQVGRARVSYSTSRSFSFVYGDIPTRAKAGLVFYRGGRRISVVQALETLGDARLKDLYFVRLNKPRGQAPDQRLAGTYWFVSAGLSTLVVAPMIAGGFFVKDRLLRNVLIGSGAGLFAIMALPQYIVGALLVRNANNNEALGRIMEQVLLSPDLESRAMQAVAAYNDRVCGGSEAGFESAPGASAVPPAVQAPAR